MWMRGNKVRSDARKSNARISAFLHSATDECNTILSVQSQFSAHSCPFSSHSTPTKRTGTVVIAVVVVVVTLIIVIVVAVRALTLAVDANKLGGISLDVMNGIVQKRLESRSLTHRVVPRVVLIVVVLDADCSSCCTSTNSRRRDGVTTAIALLTLL
jgi:hypothetical protein